MDRSLNGDDFRLFQRWEREDHPERFVAAPAYDELPGWFKQVLREQCVWLGIELAGPPFEADLSEAA